MSNALRSLMGAESEVEKLERDVARWTSEAETRNAELIELQQRSGAAVTAENPAAAVRELAVQSQELRIWIDGAQGAAQAAQKRLVVARWALDEARAAEMRDKAAKLTAIADAHDSKVNALLSQVREYEGVDYTFTEPTREDIEQMFMRSGGRPVEVLTPQSWALRAPIQPLLDEAERLEAAVAAARAINLDAGTPVVPQATINLPRWDDVDSPCWVRLEVSLGIGSVTFDVNGMVSTLPDAEGRRAVSMETRIAPGNSVVVRADGVVLATAARPGSLIPAGPRSVRVDSDRCPTCRVPAPVVRRGPSTDEGVLGPVLEVACQSGCVGGQRMQVA